tara:strand:+ start:116278 stop:118134 length:1857 start_codon:yes stop_codon:yes gene_type:complete
LKFLVDYRRRLTSACAVLAALFLVAACSGGGGGGSSSSGGGGAPSGESRASREFPDTFSASIDENVTLFMLSMGSFRFYAPDNDVPSSLVLTGPDAGLFQLTFEMSAPDSAGMRDILVVLDSSPVLSGPLEFNYEAPEDANGDNVYQFTVSGVYKGETLSANVSLTVNDVVDAAETDAGQMFTAETLFYTFASSLLLPDLTGDGLPEISIPLHPWSSDDEAILVTSEAYLSAQSGNLDLDTATSGVIRLFKKPGGATNGPGYITAAESANGFELMFTQDSAARLVLVEIGNGVDLSTLYGDFDPDLLSDKIVYTSPGNQVHGRIIGDLNDDGVNDFVVMNDNEQMGIMFGESLAQNPSRDRTFKFDILLRDYNVFESGPPQFLPEALRVQMLPDLDGDAIDDVLIFFPDGVTFYSGAELKTPGTDLQAGNYVSTFFQPMQAEILDDYDNDGIPTIGFGFYFIDGDALTGQTSGERFRIAPSGDRAEYFTAIGDIDGDGLTDLLATQQTYGVVRLLTGAFIEKYMTATPDPSRPAGEVYPEIGDIPDFNIAPRGPSNYGSFADSNPFYLASENLLIMPLSYTGTADATDSGYLLLNSEAVFQAYLDELPSIEVFISERN